MQQSTSTPSLDLSLLRQVGFHYFFNLRGGEACQGRAGVGKMALGSVAEAGPRLAPGHLERAEKLRRLK